MKKFWLVLLCVAAMGDDCDPPKPGTVGQACFDNGTCNGTLICVRWKDSEARDHSVCTDPTSLNVGGFLVPKTCEQPDMACAPCEPGWKRGR